MERSCAAAGRPTLKGKIVCCRLEANIMGKIRCCHLEANITGKIRCCHLEANINGKDHVLPPGG